MRSIRVATLVTFFGLSLSAGCTDGQIARLADAIRESGKSSPGVPGTVVVPSPSPTPTAQPSTPIPAPQASGDASHGGQVLFDGIDFSLTLPTKAWQKAEIPMPWNKVWIQRAALVDATDVKSLKTLVVLSGGIPANEVVTPQLLAAAYEIGAANANKPMTIVKRYKGDQGAQGISYRVVVANGLPADGYAFFFVKRPTFYILTIEGLVGAISESDAIRIADSFTMR